MKLDHILIIVIIILLILVIFKNKEHLLASNESIAAVTSVYANTSGTASFNNINNIAKITTTDLSANNIISNNINNATKITTTDLSANNISANNINSNKLRVNDITISGKLNAPNDKIYVWGIGEGNKLFRCVSPCTGATPWQQINAYDINKVSVGKDYIFVTDISNKAYRCKKPCDTGTWEQITGKLLDIAADNYI